MNRVEQAYLNYVRINLLPVFKKYIGDEVNSETIKKMEGELIAMLESQMIQHNWEVKVDEPQYLHPSHYICTSCGNQRPPTFDLCWQDNMFNSDKAWCEVCGKDTGYERIKK